MRPRADYRYRVFGRLIVTEELRCASHRPHRYWHCRCACGSSTVVRQDSLATGNTRSCGCKRRRTPLPNENTT